MQTQASVLLQGQRLVCQGNWDVLHLAELTKAFQKITLPQVGTMQFDGTDLIHLDSAGAFLLIDWQNKLMQRGMQISFSGFSNDTLQLLDLVKKNFNRIEQQPALLSSGFLTKIGRWASNSFSELLHYLDFLGRLAAESFRIFRKPRLFPPAAFSAQIIRTGFDALPIIGLLSCMVGIVLAYQLGMQLRNYGANVFIADLLGLAILREFGPLLTAIMVAGRTGSAFTAQLGMMKISQEIDALRTMGIAPELLLVLPRILGLLITLPLLTIWADIFGIIGGMLMAHSMLDISWYDFLNRMQHQVPLRTLVIGLGKTPVFALIIAGTGCFQGMAVKNNAESLGKNTTRSVVLSIFFIIVADAVFSVIFSWLKL